MDIGGYKVRLLDRDIGGDKVGLLGRGKFKYHVISCSISLLNIVSAYGIIIPEFGL